MVEEIVKEVEIIAAREGTYSVYVFKSIEDSEYILCTRLPNWQIPELSIGMKGFLQYQIVRAGDSYITPMGENVIYRYSNTYIVNFINKTDVVKNKEIIL